MQSINWLADNLQKDHPHLQFIHDEVFRWDPVQMIVFYNPASDDYASLLHELAHALLEHTGYTKDVELLQMERDAWRYATSILSVKYSTVIADDEVENALDTYREWLHARSTCPKCAQTGFETRKRTYNCLACGTRWRVNEARICGLKRYTLT